MPRRKRKGLLTALLFAGAALAGASLALTIMHRQPQPAAETPSPTIVITHPADTMVVVNPQPQPVDMAQQLNRQIDDYVYSYYRKHVKPVCLSVRDTVSAENDSLRNLSRQAMDHSINHCLEYGRKLAARHPDHSSEIIEHTNVAIGQAQTMVNAWLPNNRR